MKPSCKAAFLLGFALLLFSGRSGDSGEKVKQAEARAACQGLEHHGNCTTAPYSSSNTALAISSGETPVHGTMPGSRQGPADSTQEPSQIRLSPLACALQVVEKAEAPWAKVHALCGLSALSEKSGHEHEALQLLSQALGCARNMDSPDDQSRVMAAIAAGYKSMGRVGQARDLYAQALDAIDMSDIYQLETIAIGCADAGAFDLARQTFERMTPGHQRNAAMKQMAALTAKAGKVNESAQWIAELLKPFKEMKDPEFRAINESSALTEIAAAHAEAGLVKEASQLLFQAHVVALTIDDPDSLSRCLREIAGGYLQLKDQEQTSYLLTQCLQLELAREASCENARIAKAMAIAEIAGIYLSNGQKDPSVQLLLDDALELAMVLDDSNVLLSCSIADGYARIGQTAQASRLLSRAFNAARAIPAMPEDMGRDSSLSEVARGYAAIGEFTKAISVFMMMKDDFLKALELGEMVDKCTTMEELGGVRAAARRIEDEANVSFLWSDLAVQYIRIGAFERAFEAARMIKDEDANSWALSGIAVEIAKLSESNQTGLLNVVHAISQWDRLRDSSDSPKDSKVAVVH